MNSKAIKRQLLAAIAMVLVAALALGSSTFAWFANNTSVTAEGMSIAALSEGANLEISWTNSDFAPGITTIGSSSTGFNSNNYKNIKLYPTHYVKTGDSNFIGKTDKNSVNLAVGDWVHTYSNKYDSFQTADYTYESAQLEKVTALVTNNPVTTDYALVVPIYLRMNPNSNKGITDLTATATIGTSATTSSDQKMLAAARVIYVVDNAIVGDGAVSGAVVSGLGDVAAPSGGTSTVKTVYAVVYIDGEDTSCTSANYNTEDWTVSIAFNGTIA